MYCTAHALDDDEVGAHRRLRQRVADSTQVQTRAALPARHDEQPRFPTRGRHKPHWQPGMTDRLAPCQSVFAPANRQRTARSTAAAVRDNSVLAEKCSTT